MKNILRFLILILAFSCNGKPVEKIADKWPDGKKRIVLTYDNPKDTSTYLHEYFSKNGTITCRGKIANGKQEGLWEWWFDNGNKKDEATFKQDAYIGQRKHWREDGTMESIEIINGTCVGSDCCDEKVIQYSKTGLKSGEFTHSNDGQKNGMSYEYFPNGQIKKEGNYVSDQKDGLWIFRDSSGRITKKTFYKNGDANGLNLEYFSNGNIQVEGNYLNDKEEGKWIWRDSTGKLEGYKFYKNGNITSIKNLLKTK